MHDLKVHQKRVANAILQSDMTQLMWGGRPPHVEDIAKKTQAYIDAMHSFGYTARYAMVMAANIYLKAVWTQRMQLSADAYSYADRFRAIPTTHKHACRAQEMAARYWRDAQQALNLWHMNEEVRKEFEDGEVV